MRGCPPGGGRRHRAAAPVALLPTLLRSESRVQNFPSAKPARAYSSLYRTAECFSDSELTFFATLP